MEQSNQSKRVLLSVIGVAILVVAVVGVSFAFFNYTRAGADNSVGTGRIKFLSTQEGTTAVSNFFPEIPGSTTYTPGQASIATVHVTGGTTFSGGLEYRVRAVDVHNTNAVPVLIDIAETESTLSTSGHGTFTKAGTNNSGVGIVLAEGVQLAEGTITVGSGEAAAIDAWINGTFTVKAYIPADRVAISDTTGTYETTEYVNGTNDGWVNERTVITTAQWNALQANPVTFKIQVEAIEAGGRYVS